MSDLGYTPADPTLRSWDHSVAELRLGGELRAYLACVVGEMRFPGHGPWPWFVVIWPDGFTEWPHDDYGPEWWTLRELDAGRYTFAARRSVEHRRRVFGIDLGVWREGCSDEVTYDVHRLSSAEAAAVWHRFGLTDDHF